VASGVVVVAECISNEIINMAWWCQAGGKYGRR